MQVWPRKRANRPYARIRSWTIGQKAKPMAFPCYKAGMTHVMVTDNRKHSATKGSSISLPATILECPSVKIAGVRCYKEGEHGKLTAEDTLLKPDKDLLRKTRIKAKGTIEKIDPKEFSDIRILAQTQPRLIGKKKTPEIFEVALGGSNEDKLAFVKANKEFSLAEVFSEGDYVDARAVTTGRGTQGAVKRFGINLKSHRSEKSRRTPGSLGGWKGHGHFMYRIAYAGQTGYHQRIQYNNLILKISDKPDEINPKGGIVRYGNVKGNHLLIRGSIPGPKKRMIILTKPMRPHIKEETPSIETVSLESPQGR